MITAALPILAILYVKSSPANQRRLILAGLMSIPLVYGVMAAIVVSRGSGELDWDKRSEATYVGNEMFQELAFITTSVPDLVAYQMGYSYYVQLVNPIPRFLWAGKPVLDAGILMAEAKGEVDAVTGEAYLTRSPGLIGEMYLNFGWVGILVLSACGGWLVRSWDGTFERYGRSLPVFVLYCMGLAILFIMGRSFNLSMFYGVLFLTVGIYGVRALSGPPEESASAAARRFRAATIPASLQKRTFASEPTLRRMARSVYEA
jgi:oligosaccharide repeat unit polymerase